MTRVDLTVHGGGIFGLSIAWEAVRRGASVRVIEQTRIGAGASGGLVGALTPHAPEAWTPVKALQLRSLLDAEAWWQEIEATSGLSSGYGRCGRLQPLADSAAVSLAQSRAIQARSLWDDRAVWQVVATTGAEWEPASPSGFLIRDTLSARLHPRLALASLVEGLKVKSADVVIGNAEDEGAVVWATGAAGLHSLGQDLGHPVGQGVKGQAVSVYLPGYEACPQLFVDGLHIVPHVDGSIAIGSTTENEWTDPAATDTQVDTLMARTRAALPILRDAPEIARWAGLRPRARNRGPLLGPWPGRPGHYIANGGFKIGFGIAPEIARLFCDLVLEGRDGIPVDFLPR